MGAAQVPGTPAPWRESGARLEPVQVLEGSAEWLVVEGKPD
jgi:hypothetical protein